MRMDNKQFPLSLFILIAWLCFLPYDSMSQTRAVGNLTIEVTMDGDPGHGKGVQYNSQSEVANLTVSLSEMSEGAHIISFRVKDSEGNWSTTITRVLYITNPETFDFMEYFVDEDPGAGNGTPLMLSSGNTITFYVATSNLSIGLHTLYIRTGERGGAWGTAIALPFYVTSNNLSIEWFYDVDPGVGKGNRAEPDSETNVVFIPTTGLSTGAHLLSIRSVDNAGRWSTTISRPVFLTEEYGGGDYVDYECFVDTDPGTGLGKNLSLSADGKAMVVVPTDNLNEGRHTFSIRGKDRGGVWHLMGSYPFVVTNRSGVVSVEWKVSIRIVRNGNELTLHPDNSGEEYSVEVYNLDGIRIFHGEWNDTHSEFVIPVDANVHPVLVVISDKNGNRSVSRIR